MNNLTENIQKLHVPSDSMLKRSRWYGPNLFTFIATAEETGGAFAVLRCKLRRGFEPPKHVHTKEEESYVILDGEIIYEVEIKVSTLKQGTTFICQDILLTNSDWYPKQLPSFSSLHQVDLNNSFGNLADLQRLWNFLLFL